MLHKYRFLIAGIVIVLVNQAVTFAVSAYVPGALLTAGTTRYATQSSTATTSVSNGAGFVDLPGMLKYITIPSGEKGDVMVVFCSDFGSTTSDYGWIRVLIGGVSASGSDLQVEFEGASYTSQCGVFTRSNVPEGNPSIKVQMEVTTGTAGVAYHPNMVVILNSHP